jgi:hypothetical protein
MKDKLTNIRELYRLAGIVVFSLSIAACSAFSKPEPSPPCPPVSTLGDAAKVTRFIAGPGRDLIDIDFTGVISHLSGKCFYEYDSDTGQGLLRVNIRTEFLIERGAANKNGSASFDYFVSIVDDRGKVLDKQTFPYTGKYWKNRQSLKDIDAPIELSIPLTGDQVGQDFNIYVGFQLSREELEFNRNR